MSKKTSSTLFHATDIVDSWRPMLIIGKISGLIPLRIKVVNGRKLLQVHILGLLSSVMNMSFYVICLIITISHNDSLISSLIQSFVAEFGEKLQLYTSAFFIVLTFLTFMKKCGKISKAIQTLDSVDRRLEVLECNLDFDSMLKWGYISIVVLLASGLGFLSVCLYIMYQAEIGFNFFSYWAYTMPHIKLSFVSLIFGSFVMTLNYRFSCINKVFTSMYIFNRDN